MTRQHVVLCEGFDDRAFWAGWLVHLGCEDPMAGKVVYDAWDQKVTAPKWLFTTAGGAKVLVHPVQGRDNTRRTAEAYLHQHATKPVSRLLINLDSDAEGDDSSSSARDVVRGIVHDQGGDIAGGPDGPYTVDGIEVRPVIWECAEATEDPGVPGKQTLERLVCAAIASAYPGRGPAVSDWLNAEPVAETRTHKNYGMSYFAKWYAEHGHDDFYKALWRDEAVAGELKARLTTSGAWQHVEALAAD